ncbi:MULTISPECIES: DUF2237 domain-containing protein [unclassified Streptomyces]|uniref:DUF2237 domain-containing protein n=1 Tax=unclassified Streptomyces TaxID=2593676 RepID=UPI002237952B|nr:DUF2237 domain-containing protein [Streptomyces sp. SHP 1-2]MCW5253556.1 DUF2237 domain-containing protein [Streptomyces sp. SHP 1-2]
MTEQTLNILGEPLLACGFDPVTGYRRDGYCYTGPDNPKGHTVCAIVNERFIAFQSTVGNDIATPRPDLDFPGLVPGDRWCVIASKWYEAYLAGCACPLDLAATNAAALDVIPREVLMEYGSSGGGD